MPVIFPVVGDMSMLAGVSAPGRMTRVEQRTVRGAASGRAPSRVPLRGTMGTIGVSSSGAIAYLVQLLLWVVSDKGLRYEMKERRLKTRQRRFSGQEKRSKERRRGGKRELAENLIASALKKK